jgi:alanyl aminopeptidase
VVAATIDIAGSIGPHLVPQDLWPNYQRFIRKVYGAHARELGWVPKPGESEDVRLLRPLVVGLVANRGDDPEIVEQGAALARNWLDDRTAIDPEMLPAALRTAARHGGKPLYDRMLAELKKSTDARERQRLLGGLAGFNSSELVKANFDLLLSGQVDPREGTVLLFAPLDNQDTRDLPFGLIRANYDQLVARLPRTSGTDYGASLPISGEAFCDAGHRKQVEEFFKDRSAKTTGGTMVLANTLETIGQCIALQDAQQAGVAAFLRAY